MVSGLGKGVTASSIGVLLKACGHRVTSIKIDPYLNVDAGTMSPFEHGEVFVLDDGGEVRGGSGPPGACTTLRRWGCREGRERVPLLARRRGDAQCWGRHGWGAPWCC